MRAWLRMQQEDATEGWLLALRDPVVARAMNAIHQRPHEPWTIVLGTGLKSKPKIVSIAVATW